MASNRTTLDFSFVALVLSVNGRVRPDDLQSIPGVQRAQLLQSFHDAVGASQPLHFEGDVLVSGPAPAGSSASGPVPAPVPAAAPASAAASATPPTAAPMPFAPEAAPMSAPAPSITATPITAGAPPATSGGSAPAPVIPDFFGASAYQSVAPAAVPGPVAPAPAAVAPPSASIAPEPTMSDDFFTIPVPAASGPSEFFEGAAAAPGFEAPTHEATPQNVSFLFWLLPVLLTWAGGLIAFFVVRGRDAKQAKAMLVTGLVLTVVYVLLAWAAIAVGVFGSGSFAPHAGTNQPPVSATLAEPSVAADYPKWVPGKTHALVTTPLTTSTDSNAKIRQDRFYELTSPSKSVHLLAWYARSGPTTEALRSVIWVNPDTLYKGTDGSSKQALSLAAQMKKDHPGEDLLGAYPAGKPSNGSRTYDVGWAALSGGRLDHGEHVYSYSASSGWKQFSPRSVTMSSWDSNGAVK